MNDYWFENAYLDGGWKKNVRVSVTDGGVIDAIAADAADSGATRLNGFALPGFTNIHSHAFQRAMSGLSEVATSPEDSFWTWRKAMYQCAHAITPEHQLTIAKQLYLEMLKAGYTSVAEFHYLHNRPDGRHFDGHTDMSIAIIDAATETGMGLTFLPVLYMCAGFGNQPLKPEQSRFANSLDSYGQLLTKLVRSLDAADTARLGIALHSLRAVPPDAITEALALIDSLDDRAPIHIHIAEQQQEVEDCIRWSGKRPLEWLLDNHTIDQRWSMIHATHLSDTEVTRLANSGAVAGLCPTTEANLGDGFFPLVPYLQQGGKIAVGSDSNTSVSPVEELRWLEYGQRLLHQKRNLVATTHKPNTGRNLVDLSMEGGAQALGRKVGKLAPGYRADIIVLDESSPHLCGKSADYVLDSLVFSGNSPMVRDVITAGRWQVKDYRHRDEDAITADYLAAIKHLHMQME